MKKIHLKIFAGAVLTAFLFVSCSDILEEKPRTIYEPGFSKPEKELGGLASLYAHLRWIMVKHYYNTCLTVPMRQHMLRVRMRISDMDLSVDQLLLPVVVPMYCGEPHFRTLTLPAHY